jgi:UDP-N-acetylmuramoyl-tripeptide--D-alanyl-D-alanine ligase
MNIKEIYELYKCSYKVSTDTRKILDNSIFFALKGEKFNGNLFAQKAIENGASYAIIDEAIYPPDDRIIVVDDALKSMQALARYHRKMLKIPIIALTGSNGKTTTKELINTILSKSLETKATKGNLNNHIGVPLTLLSMTPQTEIGIVEMGANHPNEIDFLCTIAFPDYGMITNFGMAHLEGFGSLEGIIKTKLELFHHLRVHQKMVFVNGQDSIQLKNSEGIHRLIYGNKESSKIEFINADPFVEVSFNGLTIKSQLIGDYNYSNISAAIAIGDYFKVDHEDIREAIENYLPIANRSQIIQKGSNKVIMDAYNANPSSMKAALESLTSLKDTHKIIILGDMFELGQKAVEEHQHIAALISILPIEKAYLIGTNFSNTTHTDQKIKKYRTFDEFKKDLLPFSVKDSTILIKASRGMALERILDFL